MKTALIILDMLNTFDFPQASQLVKPAIKAAKAIYSLKQKFIKKGLPIIYVNDNFGYWQDDWNQIFKKCIDSKCKGKGIAELLRPSANDFFILKPKHSAFYATPLEILLQELNCNHLVLTGITGNICVLFTAHDAHMRNYKVHVPRDCMASMTEKDTKFTLNQLRIFKMNTVNSKYMKIK